MSDDPSTASIDESEPGASTVEGRPRTGRHLLVLLIAGIGLLVGGALVLTGRSTPHARPAATTVPPTTRVDSLLPSLGVVPDLPAAKALLKRLDPRSLRPGPASTSSLGPDRTTSTTSGSSTTLTEAPDVQATQAGIRRCLMPIRQQTTDRSLGAQIAAARLQVGVTTGLVVAYALPASGENPAAIRVVLVDARSCRILAAIQH